MEQNLQILPKKVWSLLRIFYYMLRKGISKTKLWLDLNLMMKRAKILGKTLQNLMFHHHHHWAAFATTHHPSHSHPLSFPSPPTSEYDEFSCTTSPSNNNYTFSLFPFNKKQQGKSGKEEEGIDVAALVKAMEMIQSETALPAPSLPGFGRSPMVRQLRITDSPFPLNGVDEDSHVDEAAEQFISRFYKDLRRQSKMGSFGSSSPMM